MAMYEITYQDLEILPAVAVRKEIVQISSGDEFDAEREFVRRHWGILYKVMKVTNVEDAEGGAYGKRVYPG